MSMPRRYQVSVWPLWKAGGPIHQYLFAEEKQAKRIADRCMSEASDRIVSVFDHLTGQVIYRASR